jgi:hypothetical protein
MVLCCYEDKLGEINELFVLQTSPETISLCTFYVGVKRFWQDDNNKAFRGHYD